MEWGFHVYQLDKQLIIFVAVCDFVWLHTQGIHQLTFIFFWKARWNNEVEIMANEEMH